MRYHSRLFRLLVAVAAAVLAVALRVAAGFGFDAAALVGSSWLCFLPAVVLSAWYGGLKPGLVTSAILLLAGLQFESSAMPDLYRTDSSSPESVIFSACLFALASLAICAAMQRLRMEHFRAQAAGARLHEVLESTQDAILSLDPEFRCLFANARAGQIAKKAPALLHGKSLRTIFPETPAIIIYKELNRAVREASPVHFEDHGPGNRWYAFDAYPGPEGLNLFVRDVTARRVAESERAGVARALKTEHLRLETVLREMPVGVIITSPEMRIDLVNPAAGQLFGAPVKPGDNLLDLPRGTFHTLDGLAIDPERGPLSQTLRTGERVANQEVVYTRPDGVSSTLIINALPLTGPDGVVIGALGTYLDVSALRQTQKALVASESRLRRLFESPPLGFICGDEQNILEANDAWLSMLGYTREDMQTGRVRWTELTPPEYAELDARARRQLAERGFCDPVEKELVAKDGHRVPILSGSASYGDSHWAPWASWVLDLSERRKLENRLREAGKLESIGLLAGGVAHDFNNILTSVLGNASLAFEAIAADHQARRFLENAMRSTERAADLTRQLLAYAGKGQVLIKSIDISSLAREIGQLLRCSISRNVELELELAPSLPAVEGDYTQLQQLLMNLVINGAEAVGDRPGMVRVSTEAVHVDEAWLRARGMDPDLRPGDYVSIEVRDNGCGMTPETQQRIFDPFFTTKFTGRGLGLAAATGIVRAHKGTLLVCSVPGEGSVFYVLLPALQSGPEAKQTAARQDPVVAPAASSEATIMVVDDEAIVRDTAKSALERYGYTVLVATNGREALDLYRGLSHSIAMVILDLTMPRMGGEEALCNIIAMNPSARVLLTSGFEEQATVQRLIDKGLAGFLPKPYTASVLAAKVRDVLAAP